MVATEPIRVMLVDDHDMVRRGLAAFLQVKPDLQLVGEARDGGEALDVCRQVQPDVILMDLIMPEMDGAAATKAIRDRYPSVQVIALTSFQEKDLIRDALEAGAIGYLLKNVTVDELAAAIRAAHYGQSTLAPEAVQALLQTKPAEP
ncbi:MAG: response regulator transcription factor, partial [Chloroflexota bacterium]